MPKQGSSDEVVWSPQPGPQHALVDCPLREVFFGGARGGGKTDGVLGKWAIKAEKYGAGFNAVFFRRELPNLDDAIERSHEIYPHIGGRWNEQKKTWRWDTGARVRFRPLERIQDAGKYQGQNISDACVEEAGEYPESGPIDRLFGILRSAKGVPTQLILTGNPGGPGHGWLKMRFIDPAPRGMQVLVRKLPNGAEHRSIYIPSKLENNRLLSQNDPNYVNNLYLVGSPELVRAWREGDWNVIAGAFFPEFTSEQHVIRPFKIPAHWLRYRAADWGSARPFAVYWFAVSDGSIPEFPRGALIAYREYYGMEEGRPNIGLKLTAEQVADCILAREEDEKFGMSVMDPAAFAQNGGPSIAERMGNRGVHFHPADNSRTGDRGAMGGWDLLRERLRGDGERPMIYFFSGCIHAIRTLPALQHDPGRMEDVDTDGEDHAADAIRYGCAARPWVREAPVTAQPKFPIQQPIRELFAARRRKRNGE